MSQPGNGSVVYIFTASWRLSHQTAKRASQYHSYTASWPSMSISFPVRCVFRFRVRMCVVSVSICPDRTQATYGPVPSQRNTFQRLNPSLSQSHKPISQAEVGHAKSKSPRN